MMDDADINIGDRVKIDLAPDIEAQVTALCMRKGGFRTFEVTWVHNGDIKTSWLTTDSLTKAEPKKKVGFA